MFPNPGAEVAGTWWELREMSRMKALEAIAMHKNLKVFKESVS